MAVQLINIGNVANDGTGDDLREAMVKINANFEELDLRDYELTSASNIGTGEGIFAQRLNYDLQLKSLVAGTDVSITSNASTITINADGGLKTLDLGGNIGTLSVDDNDFISIVGDNTNISTSIVGKTLAITYDGWTSLIDDTNPRLGGTLDARNNDIISVNTISATTINGTLIGNVIGNVHGIDIRTINQYFVNYWDFGILGSQYDSALEWIIDNADVDQGTFVNPDIRVIDLGDISGFLS